MPKETIARYLIKSKLGQGGMATVYLAYDPNFRRDVAIKSISVNLQDNPGFRERFEREAQLIAKIEHPAIVPVYDFGEQDGQPYLVMRYMPGGTLTEKIKAGASTLDYVSQVITQIAPALDAVHAQGIVHRDLKPGNILLDSFGNPALSDFGIAHLTATTTDLTGSAIIGTPSYMSPEQVRSDTDLDGRSDIYALGVILFEMLTGRGPFQATTPLSVALKHLTDPVPSIRSFRPDLPKEIEFILNKTLSKDRELRHANASELASELREVSSNFHENSTFERKTIRIQNNDEKTTEMDMDGNPSPKSNISDAPELDISNSNVDVSPRPSKANTTQPKSSSKKWVLIASLLSLGLILFLLCGSLGLFGAWTRLGLPSIFPGQKQIETPNQFDNPQEIILFSDDFSNPLSGWPTIQNSQGGYSYQQDGYHIKVDEQDAVIWAKTNNDFDNTTIYVEAKPITESITSYYGLLCRIQNDQNFYYFLIQSNGNYIIGKYKNGIFESLFPDGWRQSDAINQDRQSNLLRGDCVADTLRIYVNNALLDEATDTDFTIGLSGLIVGALEPQGFEVVFNNFVITEPRQ